jgi:hypothetical protein
VAAAVVAAAWLPRITVVVAVLRIVLVAAAAAVLVLVLVLELVVVVVVVVAVLVVVVAVLVVESVSRMLTASVDRRWAVPLVPCGCSLYLRAHPPFQVTATMGVLPRMGVLLHMGVSHHMGVSALLGVLLRFPGHLQCQHRPPPARRLVHSDLRCDTDTW